MSNIAINNGGVGSVVHSEGEFRDDTFDATTTDPVPEGTILARTTTSGKLGIFDPDGAGGLEVPKAVLTFTQTVPATGDNAMRPLVKGNVRKERLVVKGGTPGAGLTPAILDQLRDVAIIPLDVQELNRLDNK